MVDVTNAQVKTLFSAECTFVKGVVDVEGFPKPFLNEVAFIGRSNVGKSSLINALVGKRGLARTSNTPGRTQEINFFNLGEKILLVDLPGYGYAKAPQKKVGEWNAFIFAYLKGRVPLRRAFLLIDSRHGVLKKDEEAMDVLDKSAVPYQMILTKVDKIKESHLAKIRVSVEALKSKHPALFPEILATSSEKKIGLEDVRREIAFLSKLK
ncbi:MAG: YihA family ribosome biogenesis GTP-binding protein [Alphaproteobacteria bacterium]|nr:YihA family ribosome biogenesis GTP-binding protein [Alphaproteobacteria bacterium]